MTPKQKKILDDMVERGLSEEDILAKLKISRRTYYDYKATRPYTQISEEQKSQLQSSQ